MQPKKALGQYFLTAPSVAEAMVRAAAVGPEDLVVEIGPGKGALTAPLLARAGKVIAIEKDHALLETLRKKFRREAAEGRLELVVGDVRHADFAALTGGKPYKVVANIPYHLTGTLLRQVLSAPHPPSAAAFLLQKEVAERVAARDGKESLLSLSVKSYGAPRVVRTVRAGSFFPKPKVDSAILAVERITRTHFANSKEEEVFFALLHAAFAHKRKKALPALLRRWGEAAAAAAAACGIPVGARAEDIPFAAWHCLARALVGTHRQERGGSAATNKQGGAQAGSSTNGTP